MSNECHYCKGRYDVEDFEHPLTFQTFPTCTTCKEKLLSTKTYSVERKFFSRVGCLFVIVSIVLAIILLIARTGFIAYLLIASVVICISSMYFVELFVKKRDKNFGFDPTKYKWCKTCRNFRKIKEWDSIVSRSEIIVSSDLFPCLITNVTQTVWDQYFGTPHDDRKLFPDYCPMWTRK